MKKPDIRKELKRTERKKTIPLSLKIQRLLKKENRVLSAEYIASTLNVDDREKLYDSFCHLINEGQILKSDSGYRLPDVNNIE